MVRTKRIDIVANAAKNVVAGLVVDFEEITGLNPVAASAEVDAANLGEESSQSSLATQPQETRGEYKGNVQDLRRASLPPQGMR